MSAKSVPQPRIGKGPGINFEKSNEKLNNPKETTFRILNCQFKSDKLLMNH